MRTLVEITCLLLTALYPARRVHHLRLLLEYRLSDFTVVSATFSPPPAWGGNLGKIWRNSLSACGVSLPVLSLKISYRETLDNIQQKYLNHILRH